MARPPKLTELQKDRMLKSHKMGTPPDELMEKYGVSKPTFYRLIQENAPEESTDLTADNTPSESAVNAMRQVIDNMDCMRCGKAFDKYTGEEEKYFCCGDCYRDYTHYKWPSMPVLNGFVDVDTAESVTVLREADQGRFFVVESCAECGGAMKSSESQYCCTDCEGAWAKRVVDTPGLMKAEWMIIDRVEGKKTVSGLASEMEARGIKLMDGSLAGIAYWEQRILWLIDKGYLARGSGGRVGRTATAVAELEKRGLELIA